MIKFKTDPNLKHLQSTNLKREMFSVMNRKGENAGYQHVPVFSSPEHEVLIVSYCDHSPSVVCPSIVRSHFLVYTLASTNIKQLAQNLAKMYMTIRSRMSLIMGLIGPEQLELSALELENLPYLTMFTL